MAKKTRREELLSMFDERAAQKRCDIITRLRKEGNSLTASLDMEIKNIDISTSEAKDHMTRLHNSITAMNESVSKLITKKRTLLDEHCLRSFKRDSCGDNELHPDLIEFDENVRKEREDLLMMKLPR